MSSSMSIDDSTDTADIHPISAGPISATTQNATQQTSQLSNLSLDSENNATLHNNHDELKAPSYAFGVTNESNTESSDNNVSNAPKYSFGTDNSSNTAILCTDNNSNDNDTDNNLTTFTFGGDNSSNAVLTNDSSTLTFGTDNTSTNPTGFTFGISNNDNNTTPNEDNTSNTDNNNNSTFSVTNNDINDTSNPPFSFGVTSSASSSVPKTDFVFQTQANDNDPFAAFNTINSTPSEENTEIPVSSIDTPSITQHDATPQQEQAPSAPVIPDSAIDQEAQAKFLALFRQQTEGKWCCEACSNYNPNASNKCESCENQRKDAPPQNTNTSTPKAPPLIQTPCKISSIQFGVKSNSKENEEKYAYYDILKNEILDYDAKLHPTPRYFPYMHDERESELMEEGAAAWIQFDDDEEDIEVDDDDKNKIEAKVRTYREYLSRRNKCKEEMQRIHKDKRTIIAMAGDGSMGGQLGTANGSVTRIPNNIASFPFILDAKELRDKEILYTATGIMSTAVVTTDNELYVWGLNDKSELTINPLNIKDVDVGDDDDQLAPDEAWSRLYAHYFELITNVYKEKNPTKLEKEGFVDSLLNKRKYGKIRMFFGDKSKVTQGALGDKLQIEKIIVQFEQQCKLELEHKKKKKSKQEISWEQEIDIEETAQAMHELYVAVCRKNGVREEDESELFVPRATFEEMQQRKYRKLNPYKYLAEENNEKEFEFEYEQKKSLYEEDTFQGSLSCSYWTPARIHLPYRMQIAAVSLGGTHMVVLDTFGHVFSSGTFLNEGTVGHHYDVQKKVIVRYQRTLKRIRDLSQSTQIGKHSTLPQISAIASGANHFLMLDCDGCIWKMGVTKLGQRWCPRNIKQYLCPQRVCIASRKNRSSVKRVKFKFIACGNHHNVAISTNAQLYAWGQNIWMQCGFRKEECGYGNVVDQPRLVPFYCAKREIADISEANRRKEEYCCKRVVAGEHMTIALDANGGVWSCGRNACGALGRKTRSEGVKAYGAQRVQTEVEPDVMRQVTDLKNMRCDWIGCGSVVWFAHNKETGSVYAFGDASSGRAACGQWKSARGRAVFDEHNLQTGKYRVISANGGSDHVIFTIEKKQRTKRRNTMCFSRESSPLETNQNEKETKIVNQNHKEQIYNKELRFAKTLTNRISKKTTRKRTFQKMNEICEEKVAREKVIVLKEKEEEEEEEEEEVIVLKEPQRKRLKLSPRNSNCKPLLQNGAENKNNKTAPL